MAIADVSASSKISTPAVVPRGRADLGAPHSFVIPTLIESPSTSVDRASTVTAGQLNSRSRLPVGDRQGVRMRALCRHQATILTVVGDLDRSNVDRFGDYAKRLLLAERTLIVDLSGVTSVDVQVISALLEIDDACHAADTPWALVPGRAVEELLVNAWCAHRFPMTSTANAAMRHFTGLVQERNWLMTLTIKSPCPAEPALPGEKGLL
jgi:anti-anti-sigma regulatory factor